MREAAKDKIHAGAAGVISPVSRPLSGLDIPLLYEDEGWGGQLAEVRLAALEEDWARLRRRKRKDS